MSPPEFLSTRGSYSVCPFFISWHIQDPNWLKVNSDFCHSLDTNVRETAQHTWEPFSYVSVIYHSALGKPWNSSHGYQTERHSRGNRKAFDTDVVVEFMAVGKQKKRLWLYLLIFTSQKCQNATVISWYIITKFPNLLHVGTCDGWTCFWWVKQPWIWRSSPSWIPRLKMHVETWNADLNMH
jgi:hypothetical protein